MFKGFTLFELITVIAILSILSVLAFPSMNDYIKRNKVKTAQNDIANFVNLMRTDAIKSGKNLILCASSDGVICKSNEKTDWSRGMIAQYESVTDSSIAKLTFSDPSLQIHSHDKIELTDLGTARNIYQIKVGISNQSEASVCIEVSGHVSIKESCDVE